MGYAAFPRESKCRYGFRGTYFRFRRPSEAHGKLRYEADSICNALSLCGLSGSEDPRAAPAPLGETPELLPAAPSGEGERGAAAAAAAAAATTPSRPVPPTALPLPVSPPATPPAIRGAGVPAVDVAVEDAAAAAADEEPTGPAEAAEAVAEVEAGGG
mmetsp:Transcript_59196/g.193154  ORF Transcript_59196/g.193154 Transcript_59196/m.193154 type:complete len:158 (+) Transcript_59196:480-953(+)